MKIAYNPSGASPLSGAPENNNDIIFDLAGKAIYVKDVKLLGTDTVYDVFKKPTSSNEGGNVGLVPVPSYTNTNTRFLREDGTWVVPTNTTYSVFTGSTLENSGKAGLVPAPSAGLKRLLLSDGTWTLKFLSYDIPANSAIKIAFYSQTHATLFMRHTWSNNMGVYHISGYGSYGDMKRISIVEVTNSCSGIIYPVDGEFAVIIKNPETTNRLFVSATLLLGSISKIETVTSEVTKSDIWRNVLHSDNAFIKNGTININGVSITPLTQHLSLSNYVTLDTALVITGYKDFTRQVKISTAGNPLKLTSSTTYCDIGFNITNSDGTTVGSGIVLRGNADFKIFDAGWSNEYTILHSNNYTLYKHSYTNLTGSGTTANLAIVSTGTANGWTLKTLGSNAFDSTKYLPLTGGTLSGDLNFNHLSANVKGYITWTGGTILQRIQISDNNNTNDAVFTFLLSTNSGTDWTDLFTIKDNGYVAATSFIGNLDWSYITNKPTSFTPSAHTHTTKQITACTDYAMASQRGNVSTEDSLNAALGKIEYKALLGVTAYDWYKSITNDDTDDIINKWGEIVGFLDSVKEGTDILDEFVTRKTDLVITGKKTFYGDGSTILTVKRNHESHSTYIHFADENESLGFIGISKAHKPVFHHEQQYVILHTGNSYIKNGVITIDGASITPLTLHLSLSNYVTLDTYLKIAGLKLFNTSSNTLPLLIARGGNDESEVLKIGLDDHNAIFEFVNDETTNSFLFKFVNTDIENGGGGINANSSLVKFYGGAGGSVVIADKFMGQLDKTLTFAAGAFTAKTYHNSTAVTVNIPTHTSHLTNNSGFLTQHQSLANYVTLDGAQTITGAKTFTKIIYGNAYNYNENKAGAYLVLNKGGNYLGIGASSSNIQAIVIGESDLSGTWIKEHVTIDTSGHVEATKFIGTSKLGDWYSGRDRAAFKTTGYSGGYSPTLSIKTTNGSWELGTYDHSYFIDNLIFSYVADTDYNSDINQSARIILPYTKSGIIALTSDITKDAVGLGNVLNTAFYARTATVNGVNYEIAGTKSGATFSIYSPTTAGTSGLVLVSNGSGAPVWKSATLITAAPVEYGLLNLCVRVAAGGLTSVTNNVLTTSGVNYDTHFKLILSEPLEVDQYYTLGFYVENVPLSATSWSFGVGNQSNTNWIINITSNGWVWATGYYNNNGNSLELLIDDVSRNFYNSIKISKIVLVKGKLKAYYSPAPINLSNYTSYLGYIGTTKVQASSAAQALTGISSATISGVTSTNTLTISSTSGVGHINFSRGSYNCITMPNGGMLHILPDGVRVSSSNGMVFSSNGLHPASNSAYSLGTSSRKWDLVHAYALLSTICKSTLIELNLTGGLSNYGGFIDFHFHNSEGKPTDNLGNVIETTPDYTSRIMENAAGTLNINGATFKNGYVTSTGFIKSGSSDSYILLGGGSHKAVSDFLLKSELENLELNSNTTTIEKSLRVTKDWMDTGIKSTDIPASGSYIVQVYMHASTDYFYACYWTGLMSWYSNAVNDTESDEILLHRAGHAYNNTIYLRTKMTGSINYGGTGEGLKLLIAANKDLGAAYTFKFKFKQVI